MLAAEELALIRTAIPEESPDSNRSTGSFEPAEGIKEVLIDPEGSPDKKV